MNDAASTVTPAPGRSCGSCSMCCKVHFIPEFDKPPGKWCAHVAQGRGCSIHAERPQTCRAFYCLWMLDASFGEAWKPDRAKFVLSSMPGSGNLLIATDPTNANAWRREPYFSTIRGFIDNGAQHGQFVLVRAGARCLALMPDREIDLGVVGPDDNLAVSREMGASGMVYNVEVRKGAA